MVFVDMTIAFHCLSINSLVDLLFALVIDIS